MGTPNFKSKENVLLFLKQVNPMDLNSFLGEQTTQKLSTSYSVIGWKQGVFNIKKDSETDKKLLIQKAVAEAGITSKNTEGYDLQQLPLSQLRDIIQGKAKIRK
ncbi:MAG: hypothetical protein ACE5GL_01120 [Calditrichia bacterium]